MRDDVANEFYEDFFFNLSCKRNKYYILVTST